MSASSIELPAILGDADFPAFPVAQGLALILAGWLFRRMLVARGVAGASIATRVTVATAIATLAGGAALGLILRLPRAIAGRVDLFAPGWPMAYGALAGAAIAAAIAARRARISPRATLDALAPSLGVLVAVGRLGCFVAGCCFGEPSDAPFAVAYPRGTPAFAEHARSGLVPEGAGWSHPVHPTQLYEVLIGGAMIAAALSFARPSRRGTAFAAAAIVYAAGRFAVEIVRGDPRPIAGPLTLPQWLGIAVVAAVALDRSRSE